MPLLVPGTLSLPSAPVDNSTQQIYNEKTITLETEHPHRATMLLFRAFTAHTLSSSFLVSRRQRWISCWLRLDRS